MKIDAPNPLNCRRSAYLLTAGVAHNRYSEAGQPVGVGVTQAKDGVMYGNVLPKVYGGWDNTFRYKNFDLNVLLTYQLGSMFITVVMPAYMISASGTMQ